MKRFLISAGVVVALVFPTGAQAAIRHYEGTVDEGGTVNFDAKIRHGKARKVMNFSWADIPLHCDQGDTTSSGIFTFDIPVRDHEFQATGSTATATAKVKGEFFGRRDKRERGTIRAHGDFPPNTNCDTGKTHHHSHRV